MNIIVWLIVGGLIGWVASLIMRTDAQQGILLNIVVGIVGAVIAGFAFGGMGDPLSIRTILLALLGAVVLLGVVNLVKRGRVR